MSCYSYSKLGSQCEPNTSYSLTNNTKYISPHSTIYYKPYTSMVRYPGYTVPNEVKSFSKQHECKKDSEPKRCTSCKY